MQTQPGSAPAAEAAPPAPALVVRDLVVEIGRGRQLVRPVDGVSLRVSPGETLGLVGESGCGKTMTAMAIVRLLPPTGRIVRGDVVLGGQETTRLSAAAMRHVRGKDVAAVYQDPLSTLNPTMTIGRQIVEALRAHHRLHRRDAAERAAELLGLVGVPRPRERLSAFPFELSGGFRQRVVIAMALACHPQVLIADEPTTALDVTIQAQILDLLDNLRRNLHMAILLISHDMGVVAGRADRVAVMYAGRIVEEGDATSIFRRRRHPYTEALLASVPRPDQDRRIPLRTIPGSPPDLHHVPSGCRFRLRCPNAQPDCVTVDPILARCGGDVDHRCACHRPVEYPGSARADGRASESGSAR